MRTIRYEIDDEHDGMQVGSFLHGKGFSRAALTRLRKSDGLHLNDAHIRTVDPMKTGDILTVTFKDVSGASPNASLNARIVYDDDDVVVFDKPANMPVHTSIWHGRDTLANLFSALYPDCFFHSIGRLDKDTSGLIAVAKNKFAASKMMAPGIYQPKKLYYAVTSSKIADEFGDCGEVIAPIARDKDNVVKRAVRDDGEYARTKFRIIRSDENYSLCEVTILTGRTHQIRVHFAYIGYPLVGDKLYRGDSRILKRQALHCGRLEFVQPITGENIVLTSDLPEDIMTLFDKTDGKYSTMT